MTFQILNGDALLDLLPENILSGVIIVARECLVDGPVSGDTLPDFWKTRASFIANEYGEEQQTYFTDVVTEFDEIIAIPAGSEVNLWFEDDLFCQVNLWFCISLLNSRDDLKVNLIRPPLTDNRPDWRGFGALDRNALAKAYQDRTLLGEEDIDLLSKLWIAFKNNDRLRMTELATNASAHFPFLGEVVQAHLERHSDDHQSGRPENTLRQILKENPDHDFKTIFKEFSLREGIYGFGDSQVESLLNKLPEYKNR
ncbi:DUF1835 domain-containing protein [Dyadobacter sp. CY312]|uniref:DUF1835 domain-containing protein n=1 Tax=Dyadobacter sp. CY312 TaxID=2907303 RepID=UPI001F17AFA9|nr:DUF1835 domain-containing protein [Dyadobacter sp. CY312]MCE7040900.1 DUF1835 domain-containing protein [Dyadobacter sp. CY312]